MALAINSLRWASPGNQLLDCLLFVTGPLLSNKRKKQEFLKLFYEKSYFLSIFLSITDCNEQQRKLINKENWGKLICIIFSHLGESRKTLSEWFFLYILGLRLLVLLSSPAISYSECQPLLLAMASLDRLKNQNHLSWQYVFFICLSYSIAFPRGQILLWERFIEKKRKKHRQMSVLPLHLPTYSKN